MGKGPIVNLTKAYQKRFAGSATKLLGFKVIGQRAREKGHPAMALADVIVRGHNQREDSDFPICLYPDTVRVVIWSKDAFVITRKLLPSTAAECGKNYMLPGGVVPPNRSHFEFLREEVFRLSGVEIEACHIQHVDTRLLCAELSNARVAIYSVAFEHLRMFDQHFIPKGTAGMAEWHDGVGVMGWDVDFRNFDWVTLGILSSMRPKK